MIPRLIATDAEACGDVFYKLIELAELLKEHPEKGRAIALLQQEVQKCAIVAKSDLVFGLTRMWEALSGDTPFTKMIFRDMNDALDWLGLSGDFLDSTKVQT